MSELIVAEIKEHNLSNIEFVGFRKGEELFSYIRHASFVLVPSEWYENNPLTIIEAYSAGKPVIGSDIGGIPELIREGETGYLFRMGDSSELEAKIRRASQMSEEEYRDMSQSAYTFAREIFSEKKHYNDLMHIYHDLINERESDDSYGK